MYSTREARHSILSYIHTHPLSYLWHMMIKMLPQNEKTLVHSKPPTYHMPEDLPVDIFVGYCFQECAPLSPKLFPLPLDSWNVSEDDGFLHDDPWCFVLQHGQPLRDCKHNN